jgi:hypothetical protein
MFALEGRRRRKGPGYFQRASRDPSSKRWSW